MRGISEDGPTLLLNCDKLECGPLLNSRYLISSEVDCEEVRNVLDICQSVYVIQK